MLKNAMILMVGAALLLLAELALAQAATVSSLTGTAQATPGAGAVRNLKQGDAVNQGDTVSTGAASSIVLTFDDGQIVALTANSRLAVNNYSYNKAEPAKSNILLNLAQGGMRAITGLIGKARPQAVAYRAGNATIGIRGTDLEVGADEDDLYVIARDGEADVEAPGTLTGWVPLSGNMFGMLLPVSEEVAMDGVQLAQARATVRVRRGVAFLRIRGITRSTTPEQVRAAIVNLAKLNATLQALSAPQLEQVIQNAISRVQSRQDNNQTTPSRSDDPDNLKGTRLKLPTSTGAGGGNSNLPLCSTISPTSAQNPGTNCRTS